MHTSFDELLKNIGQRRPSQVDGNVKKFYFKDHPVVFQVGEMEGIHWVDIQIELPRFRIDHIGAARKILEANREMGVSTPIPTWFACGPKGETLFINRLDWQHISAEVLDDHIVRCIEQMSEALVAEGV